MKEPVHRSRFILVQSSGVAGVQSSRLAGARPFRLAGAQPSRPVFAHTFRFALSRTDRVRMSSYAFGIALFLALVAAAPEMANAGPNAGGVLVVHVKEVSEFSMGVTAECGGNIPSACADVVARVDTEDAVAFSLLAVFPEGSSPRVSGAIFGITYDASIHVTEYRACGDFELPTDAWPASGEGIAVTWEPAATSQILEMCTFVGYRDGDPGILATVPHPTQGAWFIDDSPIGDLDGVVDFGWLGFGVDGSYDCSVAGCCTGESCRLLPEAGCSGDYLGVGVTCAGSPCRVGACCYSDGSCAEVGQWVCERDQGIYQGADSMCTPGLCPPVPTIESSWGTLRIKFRSGS
jgi:hypothetical protein